MSAGAGARAISWARKACSLFHLQAFFKSLFCNVISRTKMQCAEDAEATRSGLFRDLIASSQCWSGQFLHPREDSWPVLMVVPIQSSLPRFRGRIALKSLLRKPDAWALLKMSAAPPASQTGGKGMGNRVVPVGEY